MADENFLGTHIQYSERMLLELEDKENAKREEWAQELLAEGWDNIESWESSDAEDFEPEEEEIEFVENDKVGEFEVEDEEEVEEYEEEVEEKEDEERSVNMSKDKPLVEDPLSMLFDKMFTRNSPLLLQLLALVTLFWISMNDDSTLGTTSRSSTTIKYHFRSGWSGDGNTASNTICWSSCGDINACFQVFRVSRCLSVETNVDADLFSSGEEDEDMMLMDNDSNGKHSAFWSVYRHRTLSDPTMIFTDPTNHIFLLYALRLS